jgi:hypothetical protein
MAKLTEPNPDQSNSYFRLGAPKGLWVRPAAGAGELYTLLKFEDRLWPGLPSLAVATTLSAT